MALHKDSYVLLNDGNRMPVIGYGTYAPQNVPKHLAEEGAKVAIDVGYRHIDSAFMYLNEAEVGRAINAKIADGTVKREDLFYTGKPEDNPFPVDENGKFLYHNTDLRDTWKAMEALKDEGLVKSIGVSNFNKRQLELILSMPGLKYKPVCNQVECHIYLNQSKLLEFCKSKDIVLVGYSVLGSSRDEQWIDQNSPVVLEDPVLNAIAKKLNRTPAQVAMRYLLQRGVVILAKSFTPARIQQNFQIFDFQLNAEEMKTLDGVNKNLRYLDLKQLADHPKYPFADDY
eukprot:XP_012814663.1 PREDICTED: aldo-keto reductase family 1, member C2 isoform X1 [Xenopus tropicalis]